MNFNYPHDPERTVLFLCACSLVFVYLANKKLAELERKVLLNLVILLAAIIGFIQVIRLLS